MSQFPQPRAGVRKIQEYHPPLGNRRNLRLDFNENTLACSPKVIEALRKLSPEDLTRYPEREFYEAKVAAHLGLQPEQVLLTNGVDEAVSVLYQTFLDDQDELLLPVPTYTMYEVYASGLATKRVCVQADDSFTFPYERVLAAITPATKIIVLVNPNSPTGAVIAREQVLEIARRAPHALVLVDEAYFHFYGETVADLIGTVPNLVLARTFSKAFGLAGLRIGVLAGPVELINWMRRVISPYSVNLVALTCLEAALDDPDYLAGYVAEVKLARAEFCQALTDRGLRLWPTQANFVLAFIGEQHKQFCALLRDKGVLVRDRSADPGCSGCVRITIGTRGQMAHALQAIDSVLLALNISSPATLLAGEKKV